jgi:ribosomal protein S19
MKSNWKIPFLFFDSEVLNGELKELALTSDSDDGVQYEKKIFLDAQVIFAPIVQRNCYISANLVGRKLRVSRGRDFLLFKVKDTMVGERFGAFALTKKMGIRIHFKVKKTDKKRKK